MAPTRLAQPDEAALLAQLDRGVVRRGGRAAQAHPRQLSVAPLLHRSSRDPPQLRLRHGVSADARRRRGLRLRRGAPAERRHLRAGETGGAAVRAPPRPRPRAGGSRRGGGRRLGRHAARGEHHRLGARSGALVPEPRLCAAAHRAVSATAVRGKILSRGTLDSCCRRLLRCATTNRCATRNDAPHYLAQTYTVTLLPSLNQLLTLRIYVHSICNELPVVV